MQIWFSKCYWETVAEIKQMIFLKYVLLVMKLH